MTAQTYTVKKRKKWFAESFSSIKDFKLKKNSVVDSETVLQNPEITLYCADFKNRQIVFTETPKGLNLTSYPFIYLAQYENAVKIITIPFTEINRLAEKLPEPEQNMIFLYTMGRAGSTLLSKMFGGDASTLSLSEPDIFADFVAPLKRYPHKKKEIEKLFSSCMKILFSGNLTKQNKNILIKPRGACIEMWDTIHNTFPKSKIIFLYRNARPVIESYMRAFLIWPILYPLVNLKLTKGFIKLFMALNTRSTKVFFPHFNKHHLKTLGQTGLPGIILVIWLSVMKTYSMLRKKTGSTAVIYEDLISDPKDIISKLFEYCGIPQSSINKALEALKKDSQKGTRMAGTTGRKKQAYINKLNMSHLNLILKHEAEINKTDYVIPGTIRPEKSAWRIL